MAGVRASDRVALPMSAFSFAFSVLALPFTYVAVPFCRPEATLLDLTATVGIVSGATAFAFAGVLISLMAVYALGTDRSRTSLMLSAGSLAVATAFLVFGLALRTCPT